MTDQLQQALTSAYEMIEADRLEEARLLLKPILAENLDNADAWWLYAHAVDDPEAARTALNNVLRIDWKYAGAAELMEKLERVYPTNALMTEPDLFIENASTSLNLVDDLELDEEALELGTDSEELRRTETAPLVPAARRSIPMLPILLLSLLLVGAIVLLIALAASGAGQQPALAPTTLAGETNGTIAAQAETQAPPTAEADASLAGERIPDKHELDQEGQLTASVADDLTLTELETALTAELTDIDLVPESAVIRDTELGRTLLVNVCTTTGNSMRTVLSRSMSRLARLADRISSAAEAVGVQLVDCDSGAVLRVIAGPVEQAVLYASGALDQERFEASWRALP